MALTADDTPMGGADTTPAIAVPDAVKVRLTDKAEELKQALIDGHIEANLLKEVLEMVGCLMDYLPGPNPLKGS